MSTFIGFFIRTPDKTKVIDRLITLAGISQVTEGIFPADHYEAFLMDESLPNYLVVGANQPGWVAVHYNSSNKLVNWCTTISRELGTEVIIIQGQTVSDYYYFAYYNKGEKIRELEFCYSTDFESVNFGQKFSFEGEEPGIKKEYDGEISFTFDLESIEEYCSHFELSLMGDPVAEVMWTALKGKSKGRTIQQFIARNKKPWWKFWLAIAIFSSAFSFRTADSRYADHCSPNSLNRIPGRHSNLQSRPQPGT